MRASARTSSAHDAACLAHAALIGALQLLCVLNRREFDGPISPLKKIQDTLIKSPILSGGPPASYKTLIKVSCHLQHSFLEIHLYYVEGAYINRPARSKAASQPPTPPGPCHCWLPAPPAALLRPQPIIMTGAGRHTATGRRHSLSHAAALPCFPWEE